MPGGVGIFFFFFFPSGKGRLKNLVGVLNYGRDVGRCMRESLVGWLKFTHFLRMIGFLVQEFTSS